MGDTPVSYYQGVDIVCYPSSNAKDDGKLNLEFNMARLVTRVTSKNFCITNPSFVVTKTTDTSNNPILSVSEGQASINGMDLIMTNSITIEPPPEEGDYHLAFKLYRDGKGNVQGDFERGVDTIFQGLYLTYFNQKDETDKDVLYLAQVHWDGTDFTSIQDDEDKYGRIWAEDILCKIDDPKHPTITRLLLQDWLYNVPDWYFSKEGDVIYGKLEMTDGREGSGQPGIIMQAKDSATSEIIVKAPTTALTDLDRIGKFTADSTKVELDIGKTILKSDYTDENNFSLTSVNNVTIHSDKTLKLEGDTGVEIGTGGNEDSPKLVLRDHQATLTDSKSANNKFNINFIDSKTIQQTLGKAIWEYNSTTKIVSLLTTDVTKFNIKPASLFEGIVDVNSQLTVGTSQTNIARLTPSTVYVLNGNSNGTLDTTGLVINNAVTPPSVILQKTDGTQVANLNGNGSLTLTNKTTKTPLINFVEGNTNNDITLQKVASTKALDLNGELRTDGLVSRQDVTGQVLITTSGEVRFTNGSGTQASLQKGTDTTIYSTAGFNVGATGNQRLKAGATTISSTLNVAGDYTTVNGNITTTNGTITGKKVLGAVYQDLAEAYEKDTTEIIEEGDLVFITDEGKVSKPQTVSDCKRIIGVCSENPGVGLGVNLYTDETRCMVGIVGKLYVKTEQTFLTYGDYVKAVPGGVRKVSNLITDLPYIVGKVIEPYKDGKVRINFRMAI